MDYYTLAPIARPLDQWVFICVVWDRGAGTLILYRDGAAVPARPFAMPPVMSQPFSGGTFSDDPFWPLLYGYYDAIGGSTGSVSLDELGFCLNKALNADGVTALYNGGNGLTWPDVKPFLLS